MLPASGTPQLPSMALAAARQLRPCTLPPGPLAPGPCVHGSTGGRGWPGSFLVCRSGCAWTTPASVPSTRSALGRALWDAWPTPMISSSGPSRPPSARRCGTAPSASGVAVRRRPLAASPCPGVPGVCTARAAVSARATTYAYGPRRLPSARRCQQGHPLCISAGSPQLPAAVGAGACAEQ